MTQAAVDLATQVARLQAAGARNIVVYGLPDIGLTPAAAVAGRAGERHRDHRTSSTRTLNAALARERRCR